MAEMLAAGDGVYAELKNLIVWVKDNGGMGTFYRSRHELIFAFKNGTAPHINAFELGQHGRYRTNVWQYRGVNTLKAGRMDELALHPTVKPVQMIADAIKDVSGRGDIVLDLFGGSGSTLIAAQKTGRRAWLCELDPVYCDRIIRRWEAYAKDEAEQIACGIGQRRVLCARLPNEAPDDPTAKGAWQRGRRAPLRGRLWQAAGQHAASSPGQSGNPKGRPKGSKNKSKVPALNEERMKSILLEEAYRTIKVNEGSGQVTVPMAQAVIRSLAVNAAKGNQRAQRLFTELLFTTERENKRLHDEWLDAAITYKVEWERELARRERLGITGPEPLPHPDHVVINYPHRRG